MTTNGEFLLERGDDLLGAVAAPLGGLDAHPERLLDILGSGGGALDVSGGACLCDGRAKLAFAHRATVAATHTQVCAHVVALQPSDDERHSGTVFLKFGNPVRVNAGEAIAVGEVEADENRVATVVSQRANLLLHVGARGVQHSQAARVPGRHFDLGGVIVEIGREVILDEEVLGQSHGQGGLAAAGVPDEDEAFLVCPAHL